MSDLAGLESAFQDYVLNRNSHILSSIAGPDESFRSTRLDIYFDAYRLRLREALGKDYEILKAFVGDAIFDEIARGYVSSHASVFRNVRWYGQDLADYLLQTRVVSHQQALSELARFEWTLGLAFDAADEPSVGFEDVAAVAPECWETLRFRPHASVHLLECATNAVAIWRAQKEDNEGVAPMVLSEPQTWIVWRHDYASFFRSLETDAAWAMRAMCSGASFPEICEGLCNWVAETDAAARAAALLRTWVDEGWIAKLLKHSVELH